MEKGGDGPDLTLNLFLRFPDPVSFVNTPDTLRLSTSFRDPCSLYGGLYVLGFRFGSGPAFLYGKMAEAGNGSQFFD